MFNYCFANTGLWLLANRITHRKREILSFQNNKRLDRFEKRIPYGVTPTTIYQRNLAIVKTDDIFISGVVE